MSERKFTRALSKIGTAALARESASLAVRESMSARTQLIDPIDYESVIQEKWNLIVNDTERDLLLFPQKDFKSERVPQKRRTKNNESPVNCDKELDSPLSRECVKLYTDDWTIVTWINAQLMGSFTELPRCLAKCDELKTHVFDNGVDDETSKSQFTGIIRLEQFALETEYSIAMSRRESRVNLFAVYPDLMTRKGPFITLRNEELNCSTGFEPKTGIKFELKCNSVEFGLKLEDGTHLEPYFTSVALFDSKNGKLSEEFRFDVNSLKARELIPVSSDTKVRNSSAIFNVEVSSNDLFLVLRVEKILQASPMESYLRVKEDTNDKIASKVYKHLKEVCARLGAYRQPFVWTAKPVFKFDTNQIDASNDFASFYRQDSNRITDDDITRALMGNEKIRSSTIVPGRVRIAIKEIKSSDTIDSNEMESLHMNASPHMRFVNLLYVFPRSLKFDGQKAFAKARNVAVTVELRDDDSGDHVKPLRAIFGRPHEPEMIERMTCSVQHHNSSPEFYDEIKILLPTNLTEKHHLLFSFSHVSCSNKRDAPITSPVGFSWLPLYSRTKVVCEPISLSVACHLPPGYLGYQQLGLGKGFSGPDIRWCGRDLFHVDVKLVSSIYSRDANILAFLVNSTRMMDATNDFSVSDSGREISKFVQIQHAMPKLLKALHTSDTTEIIRFLSVLLSQLFRLIVTCTSEEVALCSTRAVLHILQVIHDSQQKSLLRSYVELLHSSCSVAGSHLHEELTKAITNLINGSSEEDVIIILRHIGFLLHVLSKSMALYVIEANRIKMRRNERFSREFHTQITQFVNRILDHIVSHARDHPLEPRSANLSLAHFLSRVMSLMDRGFAFTLIKSCLELYSSSLPLHELKYAFLAIITSHEHYVPLNLPLKTNHFQLTTAFCRNHFLVGLLLQELNSALSQVHHVRSMAVYVLRNIIAKHAFDERYTSRASQERIALLYFPLISIILENFHRIHGNIIPSHSPSVQTSDVQSNSNLTPKLTPRDYNNRRATIHEGQIKKNTSYWSSLQHMHAAVSIQTNDEPIVNETNDKKPSHVRSQSLPVRLDKLHNDEVRDLLICFTYVCGHLSPESLISWFSQGSPQEIVDFFGLLDTCLLCFQYDPRYRNSSSNEDKAKTLPARVTLEESRDEVYCALLAANLSTEVGLIILDIIGTFCMNFKDKYLLINYGDNHVMRRVFDIYLSLLSLPQSETLLCHVFASLRVFCVKFSCIFFNIDPQLYLSKLCYQLLQCCTSRVASVRSEASSLTYWLMRCNYLYFNGNNGITIFHLQVIVRVSQLLGDPSHAHTIQSDRFHHSIEMINNYATSDISLSNTQFLSLVRELTQRVQTVLSATAQISEESRDKEKTADLHLQLANSYSKTCPELRRTWLESMAKIHIANDQLSEAAMCYVHIAAVQSEYLKRKGIKAIDGLKAFENVSVNVIHDESECDYEREQTNLSESTLTVTIDDCAKYFARADRFESASQVMKAVIGLYERDANHESLSCIYDSMAKMHSRALEANRSGKRLLGTYFLVGFHGITRKDLHTHEFIYKEPKVTSLAEFSLRMRDIFEHKYGTGKVNLITDADNVESLDSTKALIAITHVTPVHENARDEFERNNGIKKFTFETPFTRNGGAHAQCVSEQYRRRVVLTCSRAFPYVVKRIPVTAREEHVLTPIEVAIEEMRARTRELKEVSAGRDIKRLQLVLQGSVHVTVNAGPIAYARAFLVIKKDETFEIQLKHIFAEFVSACEEALNVNARFIMNDQSEYHMSLKTNFELLKNELQSYIFSDEDLSGKRTSMQIFDVISGTSIA